MELYWAIPLTYMRGVTVYVARVRKTVAVNDPSMRSTQFTEAVGSTEKRGPMLMRPLRTASVVRRPL